MKKNMMMRIASVLLVAVLLSTCAISGTFAKYASTATKSDNARVALWDIDFNVNDTTSKDFVFDLFNTVYEEDATTDEDHVAVGNGETIIAPGTGGYFDIVLKNNSEVDAQFKIDFAETLNDVPLTFTYTYSYSDMQTTASFTEGSYVTFDMGDTVTVRVTWAWEIGGITNGTGDDNHLGDGDTTVSVEATVTVEQVD